MLFILCFFEIVLILLSPSTVSFDKPYKIIHGTFSESRF